MGNSTKALSQPSVSCQPGNPANPARGPSALVPCRDAAPERERPPQLPQRPTAASMEGLKGHQQQGAPACACVSGSGSGLLLAPPQHSSSLSQVSVLTTLGTAAGGLTVRPFRQPIAEACTPKRSLSSPGSCHWHGRCQPAGESNYRFVSASSTHLAVTGAEQSRAEQRAKQVNCQAISRWRSRLLGPLALGQPPTPQSLCYAILARQRQRQGLPSPEPHAPSPWSGLITCLLSQNAAQGEPS